MVVIDIEYFEFLFEVNLFSVFFFYLFEDDLKVL